MKTHKRLWDDFLSDENFELAARRAVKSKKSTAAARHFVEHRAEYLARLRDLLIRGEFQTSKYKVFKIFEPKERDIYMLPLFPDHVVQHALINVLGPIWHRMFISDSYACIPGRGLHAGSRRMMTFVRRNKYALQCDVRKFFPSIRHDIMIRIIRRKISDERIMALLENIICSGGDGRNLPIGNLTSQWMGNVYLNELDYFVKHRLHWRDYIRYCDDFCLLGNDKRALNDAGRRIKDFLEHELDLRFSKCCLIPTACGVNFIGYRHFPRFVLMRRRGAQRLRRRVNQILRHNDTSPRARSQIAAARGWMKWACSFNFRRKLFAPFA